MSVLSSILKEEISPALIPNILYTYNNATERSILKSDR